MTEEQLRQSILKRAPQEVLWAESLLPADLKADAQVLHIFWQTSWELTQLSDKAGARRELEARREVLRTRRPPDAQLWRDFFIVIKRQRLPLTFFTHFLSGIADEIHTRQPRTYHDLEQHLTKTHGSVAVICARLAGASKQATLKAASQLGVAVGLTDILAGLPADLQAGRIKLPASLLKEVRVSPRELVSPLPAPATIVLAKLATQAAAYYDAAERSLDDLSGQGRKPAELILRTNRARLQAVTDSDFDVFSKPPALSIIKRRAILVRVKLGRDLTH